LKVRNVSTAKRSFEDATEDEKFVSDIAALFRDKLFAAGRHRRADRYGKMFKDLAVSKEFITWFKVRSTFRIHSITFFSRKFCHFHNSDFYFFLLLFQDANKIINGTTFNNFKKEWPLIPKTKKELEMCKKLALITPGYVVPTIDVDSRSSSVNDGDDDDNGDDEDTDGDNENEDADGESDDIQHVRPPQATENATKPTTSRKRKTDPPAGTSSDNATYSVRPLKLNKLKFKKMKRS